MRTVGCCFTYQCLVQDYPFQGALRALLDVCDQVIVLDGESTDGTFEELERVQAEVGPDRLRLHQMQFNHTRRFWYEARVWLLGQVGRRDYVFFLDADEVFHEDQAHLIRDLIERRAKQLTFNYTHFYGDPGHWMDNPALYPRNTRAWKRSSGLHWVYFENGCADDLVTRWGRSGHTTSTDQGLRMYHYGWARSPKAMGMKSGRFEAFYAGSEDYRDGELPQPTPFAYNMDDPHIRAFAGSHPKYMKDWIDKHQGQPTSWSPR